MKHSTWMNIAHVIAVQESKCIAHRVGAVIVKNGRVVSTGYNGSPSKQANCCDVNNHLLVNGEFQNFVDDDAKEKHHHWSQMHELHAEHNALLYANPSDRIGSTLYCTMQPCQHCSVLIAGSGVSTVIYDQEYHRTPKEALDVLTKAGIVVLKLSEVDAYEMAKLKKETEIGVRYD